MTKIICRASDCIYWDEGVCASEEIIYDPEQGCLTFESIEDVLLEDEAEWEDDEILDEEAIGWNADDDGLLNVDDDDIDEDWNV